MYSIINTRTRFHSRLILTVSITLLVITSLLPLASAQAMALDARTSAASQHTPLLRDMVGADGSLNLPPGFSGSLDPEGMTLVTSANGSPRFVAAPVVGKSQWDDRFGSPGVANLTGFSTNITAMVAAADGSLFVGGHFDKAGSIPAGHIARWDGKAWYALGAGLNQAPEQLAFDGANLYVVGDNLTQAGNALVNDIARWNGRTWYPVGTGVGPRYVDEFGEQDGRLHSVAIWNGELVVGGYFNHLDGTPVKGIARFSGGRWLAFGKGLGKIDFDGETFVGTGEINAIVPSGGKLYVGGSFTHAGTLVVNNIAVWNGTAWSALGSGIGNPDGWFSFDRVQAIAVSGNTVYAGGRFTTAGGRPANHIARWNGTAWSALGAGVNEEFEGIDPLVNSIVLDGADVYVGGEFLFSGGIARAALARWNGTAWATVGAGIPPGPSNESEVYALARTEQGVYAAGYLETVADKRVDGIALWTRAEWRTLGQGLMKGEAGDIPGEIYAICVDAAGRVYVGGTFVRAGGVAVQHIAMWDGVRWSSLGGGANGYVSALVAVGNAVFAGGDFTQIGGVAAQHVARYSAATGQWSALGSGINGTVNALAFGDGILYAGGGFTAAGDATAYDVAYWTGSRWRSFGTTYRIYEPSREGGEAGTYVNALAVQGSTVIVGGHFQTIHRIGTDPTSPANLVLVNNVVGWNRANDGWFTLGPQTATQEPGVTTDGFSGFGTDVNAVAISGADVFVGGDFNLAGNVAAANIARWNSATNTWASLSTGVAGFNSGLRPTEVNALAVIGTRLFATGHFTSAGPAAARFVAQWDIAKKAWSPLGTGLRWYNDEFTYGYSLAATPTGVYVGGNFDRAGDRPAAGLARWASPIATVPVTPEAGGALTVEGGTITIPAGAVANQAVARLTTRWAPSVSAPAGQVAVQGVALEATVAGQALTQFAQPVTIRMTYSTATINALKVREGTLTIARLDGTTWTPLFPCAAGCSLDTTNNIITVVTDRVGEFALLGSN